MRERGREGERGEGEREREGVGRYAEEGVRVWQTERLPVKPCKRSKTQRDTITLLMEICCCCCCLLTATAI